MSDLATSLRTHTCAELRASNVPGPKRAEFRVPADDTEVLVPRGVSQPPAVMLCGQVDQIIDPTTIVLRDHYGKTLVKVDPGALPYVPDRFTKLGLEDVVQVGGDAALRAEGEKDAQNPTGDVYLKARKIEILRMSMPVPEGVLRSQKVPLEERLSFRQVYLRRPEVQQRMAVRSQVSAETREFFWANDFIELETPQLFLFDPVALGSDLVPMTEHRAFGLSGGPLVFNQYIRAGQFDRFFQLVPITTNEKEKSPLHAQEFTGLDINMAYVDTPDFFAMVDALVVHLFRSVLGYELKAPVRLTHADAMLKYGSEKPDLRFEMLLSDLGDVAGAQKVARAFVAPKAGEKLKDTELRELCGAAQWARVDAAGKLEGPAAELLKSKVKSLGAGMGDAIIVATAGRANAAAEIAGGARVRFAQKLGLIDEKRHEFAWVHNMPVFDDDGRPKSIVFARLAREEDREIFLKRNEDRKKTQAKAFDLVLDGVEVASGFVGTHHLTEQRQFWERIHQLDLTDMSRMRAPIEGHRFGCPPYAAMNIGFDRLLARMMNLDSIDEVVAFPKSYDCKLVVTGAPAPVPAAAVANIVPVDAPTPVEEERVEA